MGPMVEDTGNNKTMMHGSESGADVSSTTSEMMAENEAASDDARGGSNGNGNSSDKDGMPSLDAQKDDALVKWAQGTVLLVLLLSAATVATLSYVLLSNSEANSFHAQFDSSARQVILMANRNTANVFTSFGTLAAIYPANSQRANETLPFVTLDGFDKVVSNLLNSSKASLIHFAPLLKTQQELEQWNDYSSSHTSWVAQGRRHQSFDDNSNTSDAFMPYAFDQASNWTITPSSVSSQNANGYVCPVWQMSPLPPRLDLINYNTYTLEASRVSMDHAAATGEPSLTEPVPVLRDLFPIDVEGPISLLHYPVYKDIDSSSEEDVVAFVSGILAWKTFFDNALPEGPEEVLVVVESCSVQSTFLIQGPTATFIGEGSLHNSKYNDMQRSEIFVGGAAAQDVATEQKGQCQHRVHVFPTERMQAAHVTNKPVRYAVVVVAIFAFAALVFHFFAVYVARRQDRTERQANQSNAIVQELFPGDVATKLFETDVEMPRSPARRISNTMKVERTNTIAELHPDATVLFADIAGFTAWSSIREPPQVFTLLEAIFQAFDTLAKKHSIFKVETIGDCYVAACGVPTSNPAHAVVMSRFARSIVVKFRCICRDLELTLGPDTGDLGLRVGMHSGPVTAGVLRGERARFQLFGDTVNTASRMESTGMRERVHISEQTALQLINSDKEDWIVKREDMIEAKGKGKLLTYWLKLSTVSRPTGSVLDEEPSQSLVRSNSEWDVELLVSQATEASQKNKRLIHWNSELLRGLLQRVVSHRATVRTQTGSNGDNSKVSRKTLTAMARVIGRGTTVVEEVVEIIDMPELVYGGRLTRSSSLADVAAELSDDVVSQLRDFVTEISSMYKDNKFHNFEHASHVAMSVNKLLGRIVAPSPMDLCISLDDDSHTDEHAAAQTLHDHTCGITSDPLTQFAVVLSALIHDLDHPGVSNAQFMKEDPKLAMRYKEKSVAEQNSVDLAWSVLMMSDYNDLRKAIFTTEAELRRFRSLLVNSIIATDIFDKDLGTLRKNRWNKAFYETTPGDDAHEVQSRKATIVIEHLIQASDVAHTMQHWHVYQKWNQRLFDEMMTAFRAGRSETDPREGWYHGELSFFDNYIIPLANKLKECGLFGVTSTEYLMYAKHNRDEWQSKGESVVQYYVECFEKSLENEANEAARSARKLL